MDSADSDDASFLDSVPYGMLIQFRTSIYNDEYVASNPNKFANTSWIDIPALRRFMSDQQTRVRRDPDANSVVSDASIKRERDQSPQIAIKKEAVEPTVNGTPFNHVGTRTYREGDIEIVEILDSDEESNPVDEFEEDSARSYSMGDCSSDTLYGDFCDEDDEEDSDDPVLEVESLHEACSSDFEDMDNSQGIKSSVTAWLDDDDVSSTIEGGTDSVFHVTRQNKVDVLERVEGLPSLWPVPRDRRAYLLDLSDEKYSFRNKDGNLIPVDTLIKNHDQDSWTGTSGGGVNDSKPLSTIFGPGPDGKGVPCRRSRLRCSGIYACELIEPTLVDDVVRHELDPELLQNIVRAQISSRLTEANTGEKQALIFFGVINASRCGSENPNKNGERCEGAPELKRFKKMKNGKQYFIACSGWHPSWRTGHQSWSIPDAVQEKFLELLFAGKALPGFEKPLRCSRIVSAHTGARVKICQYPHNGNGKRARLEQKPCPAQKTIYVPLDTSIRQVVFNNEKPHNHPILPFSKATLTTQKAYTACIQAFGVLGSTVNKIENAPTTQLLLGTTPSLYSPALQNTRMKRDMLAREKKKLYPFGTDLPGVQHQLAREKGLSHDKRYIWSITDVLETGGTVIFTANSFLLSRIHLTNYIHVDTTFKRTFGDFNEWEVVTWDKETQRAITVCRVYSNRADTPQYRTIFDDLQHVTKVATKRQVRLSALSKDGTLDAVGVDLELAQVLGAGESFAPTNEPEYSGITDTSPEELAMHFVRGCHGHCKRGIQKMRPSDMGDEAYNRIMNFMHLTSQEEIDEFSQWIKSLKNAGVQAWWNHKVQNRWILPSLVKCLSKMPAEKWDQVPATTNLGEAQHHWSNDNTGISLSLLEAILTARECDERTAAEMQAALANGILKNNRNNEATRMQRNMKRNNNATKKARENREANAAIGALDDEIGSIQQSRKEEAERLKALKAKKAEMLGGSASKRTKSCASKAESNSSGRVMTTGSTKQAKARQAATKAQKKAAASVRHSTPPATDKMPVDLPCTGDAVSAVQQALPLSGNAATFSPPRHTFAPADPLPFTNMTAGPTVNIDMQGESSRWTPASSSTAAFTYSSQLDITAQAANATSFFDSASLIASGPSGPYHSDTFDFSGMDTDTDMLEVFQYFQGVNGASLDDDTFLHAAEEFLDVFQPQL